MSRTAPKIALAAGSLALAFLGAEVLLRARGFDPLAAVMALIVTGVSFLIHVYSIGYMSEDKGYARYFAYLNLFTFFMLVLVTGGSLALMFVGWEGVGLCSYLLIGFWFKKKSASDAGKKAFIVNRVGDAGLIIGMALAAATAAGGQAIDVGVAPALQRTMPTGSKVTVSGRKR